MPDGSGDGVGAADADGLVHVAHDGDWMGGSWAGAEASGVV